MASRGAAATIADAADERSGREPRGPYRPARERGVAAAYVRDAFHAAWGEGARLDDPEVLARLAEARGWDAAGFLRYVDSPAAAAALESATAQAVARGVFGVPTMTIGSDMWWGNDRLFMLERHLAKMAADCKAR